MTVTTTAPKSSRLRNLHQLQLWASATLGMLGIFLVGAPSRRRLLSRLLGSFAILVCLAAVGCGGGGSSSAIVQHDPGTTAGTYNATIVATSGTLVHRVGFQLVVQ